VSTARYALSPYIKQIRFVFKGLIAPAELLFIWHHISFPKVKRPGGGGDVNHSRPSSAEVRNKWSCTSASLYVLILLTGTTLPSPVCYANFPLDDSTFPQRPTWNTPANPCSHLSRRASGEVSECHLPPTITVAEAYLWPCLSCIGPDPSVPPPRPDQYQ
jgi:hypothetical protein